MPHLEAEHVLVTASFMKRGVDTTASLGVRPTYLDGLREANFHPVLVGSNMSRESLRRQFQKAAAIVFTGGLDFDPTLYGQSPLPETEVPDRERDDVELELMQWALDNEMPLIGICRGAQGLAIAVQRLYNITGDSILIQHLPHITPHVHTVKSYDDLTAHKHPIEIVPNTLAHEIYPSEEILMASGHHQAGSQTAIEKISVLVISGYSSLDRVVEMIELKRSQHPFCLGIQGHPEIDRDLREPLFRRLYIEAQKYAALQSVRYAGF